MPPQRPPAGVSLGSDDPPVQRLDLLDRLSQVIRGGHRIRHGADLRADVHRDDVGDSSSSDLGVRWLPVPAGGDLDRVRWYLRYGLSYRDVEELLAERGRESSTS
jgi:hypothetical protein